MPGLTELPANPAALASIRAEQAAFSSDAFVISRHDEFVLVGLDKAADDLGFIGTKYFVESHRSLSVPVSFDEEHASYMSFPGLTFEGEFKAYSKVLVGKLIGAGSIRALCLAFDNVTLLPYFDGIPQDHLLHVPVLAVSSIDAQSAA